MHCRRVHGIIKSSISRYLIFLAEVNRFSRGVYPNIVIFIPHDPLSRRVLANRAGVPGRGSCFKILKLFHLIVVRGGDSSPLTLSMLGLDVLHGFSLISHLTTHTDQDIQIRHILASIARPRLLHHPDNLHAIHHPPEDNMLSIQKRRRNGRDEELASIRVGSPVGHTQEARTVVFEREVLVRHRLGAVDGGASCAISVEEVAALEHEILDDSVEFGAFVALRTTQVVLGLSRAELPEVLGRLWDHVCEELEGHAS